MAVLQYDIMVELEEKIEDGKLRRRSVERVYDRINDEERKALVSSLIKEIQIYPRGETEVPLKSISFNFPVYKDGQEGASTLHYQELYRFFV